MTDGYKINKIFVGADQVRPSSGGGGWQPTAHTLFYLSLDQSNAVFTDAVGHSVNNNGVSYNSNGVSEGCGYNNSDGKRVQALFDAGDTFPSSFTIMAFMKPTGSHYTSDHPMGIVLSKESTKVLWGIGFNQSNSQVQWNYLRENVAWATSTDSSVTIANTWHHYALTWDGTKVEGFIDGVRKVSANRSGSGSGSYYPVEGLTLFGRVQSAGQYTNTIQGFVDEAICEDKVWTQSEIQDYLSNYTY